MPRSSSEAHQIELSLSAFSTEINTDNDILIVKVTIASLFWSDGLWLFHSRRIFLSLMEAAGLTDLLKQDGDFTLFAPTDEAFAGLSERDLSLLKSEFLYVNQD